MSKRIRMLILFTLLVSALAACSTVKAGSEAESQAAPLSATKTVNTVEVSEPPAVPRTITVVGEGTVKLKPDIAEINVGSEARAETVSEAKSEVDAQMAAITAALKEAGIAEKDIQAAHYGIHYEREPIPSVGSGAPTEFRESYVVNNMVRVIVRDVETAGDVLDAVVQAGANQVYGVSFTVSDESAWQSQARAAAMADATSRAEELAELAGVELGEVLTVSEVIGSMPTTAMGFERPMGGGGGGMSPGELEVGTRIQVMFAAQ